MSSTILILVFLSIYSYLALSQLIKNRQDIKGELQEYLIDLVDYVSTGNGGLTGYKFTEFPMASITKDFGEVLGLSLIHI